MDKKQLIVFGVAGLVVYGAWRLFGKKKDAETATETPAVIDDKKGGENESN